MSLRLSLSAAVMLGGLGMVPLAAPAQAGTLPSRENNAGMVMVTATPLDVSPSAKQWRFAVKLNTHVSPITQDLAAVSSLSGDQGKAEAPTAWQGTPPGGHHRSGVLIFPAINPMPQAITLTIREVGAVPERSFTWTLNEKSAAAGK